MIKSGDFREDLYYRLSELTINIPAVREREGDAVLLARTFVEKFAKEQGKKIPSFDKNALVAIENYQWPGNVRELENRIKRALIMFEGNQISTEDLELEEVDEQSLAFNLREVREKAEKKAVLRALHHANSNIAHASELLGVSRPTLYDLLKKLNIEN